LEGERQANARVGEIAAEFGVKRQPGAQEGKELEEAPTDNVALA
jgi:hypothetical protein